ncbi:phage tail domain-containing protein [Chengkuizengella marina]|uniref:Phage tail family protein n=1 Tax=Chengkuizengella marina TaxID=2507566 RepID=A0A6N9Q7U9_9BACL|nr:phage tail domain-containing protein [Chengkuizengella marina]NBI30771.1 phage tail family protein [Chengkuizengella marina]
MDLRGGGNIGGTSFESLGLLLTKADIPLLPTTRQIEEEIPGYDGILDLGTEFGARMIELTFNMMESDEVTFQSKLSAIASMFNPRKGIQPLVLNRSSGKQYFVKFNGTIPIERVAQFGTFTVPLKAFDPFAYSVTDTSEPLQFGQGYTFGQGLRAGSPYSFSITNEVTNFNVYHAGNMEVKPLIRISGKGSNIVMTNDTTQEGFSLLDLSLNSDDVLEMDCATSRILLNGSNALYAFTGMFPKLAEGDNAFEFTASTPNMTIDFVFKHRYLY